MQGYVARKGNRYYAVIYEGIDPLTGRERRRWHPAGTDRAVAETLASRSRRATRRDAATSDGSLTVAVYLTQRWLPSKQLALRPSTWDSYRRNIDLHVVPRDRTDPAPPPPPRSPRTALRRSARRRTRRRQRWAQQQDRRRDPHDPAPRTRRRRAARADPGQPGHGSPTPRSGGRCRATPPGSGPPTNSASSSPRPGTTATTPHCGSPPTPGCDAARSSASDGATSTSTSHTCASPDHSCRSATSSTRHAASPAPPGERSTSTHHHRVLHTWRQQRRRRGPRVRPRRSRRSRVRPARRHPNAPTTAVGRVPETRAPIRPAPSPVPRPPPHPRHAAAQSRRADQGRQRTTRTLHPWVHDGDLPARHPRHATRSRPDLRRHPPTLRRSTDFYPVEVTVEDHPDAKRPWSGQVP